MSSDKFHWYSLAFMGDPLGGGPTIFIHSYCGCVKKDAITIDVIQEHKASAGVAPTATLLSVSYLGLMTKDEFEGNEDD